MLKKLQLFYGFLSDRQPDPQLPPRSRSYLYVLPGLLLLLAGVTVGHLSQLSPYSYGWACLGMDVSKSVIEKQAVNPDALSIVPLTIGFLKPCGVDYQAPNIHLPLHSMASATIVTFTRSYMLSHWLLNYGILALLIASLVRICRELSIPPAATAVAGCHIMLLPWIAHYVGQPMQYVFGVSLNCLLIIAIVRMAEAGRKNPWALGAAIAVMTLNYDWYIFTIAVLAYLICFDRFQRLRDWGILVVIGFAPMIAWGWFLDWASNGQLDTKISNQFFGPIAENWMLLATTPSKYLPYLYIMPHIALDVMFKSLVSLIWWPVLLGVTICAIREKPPVLQTRWGRMSLMIFVVYALEQFATAAFDWENSSRRALPVMLSFAVLVTWVVARSWTKPILRALFVGLAVVSFTLTFADTFIRLPAPGLAQIGEEIRGVPKAPMRFIDKRFGMRTHALMPPRAAPPIRKFQPNCGQLGDPDWSGTAHDNGVPITAGMSRGRLLFDFVLAQGITLLAAMVVAVILRRGRLISRIATLATVAAVALSVGLRLIQLLAST